ncbi:MULTISPECIES: putative lipid II flippase FtsW [Arthrobacter]|uniref:Probable peptidoglycan glycosyltransferase FtsW n=2 Tax=Arthrobacter TaxID=1663 RepID=A0ABU9KH42_9MICC|nr:putative lipid II flippase FtsW [Arthrobacter sp. YJM1]MDP5226203.1 putative lipid II flippase FtsW [Arthrobacter sp. YJM1]
MQNASRQPRGLLPRARTALDRLFQRIEGRGAAANSAYYLILGSTIALTAIGVLMVISASSVESIAAGQSPYADGLKQGVVALIGFVAMFLLSRSNVAFWHRIAWPAYFLAVLLLLSLFVIGIRVMGNLNWINVGGFSVQPSETAKLAMSVWLAHILARKEKLLGQWKHVVMPAIIFSGAIVAIVMIQHDLGTALILMALLFSALFFAGVNFKILTAFGLSLVAAAGVAALTSGNRMCRITTWVTGQNCSDSYDSAYQSTNGLYGLATGGLLGTGLGQSRQKYSWIPEAHNDFIFAIVGEELGLVGALVVLALFAVLGLSIYRVVIRQEQLFHRVLGGTIMVWILGQAALNMAMVTGLMPVIGVPLPLISYGGSALLMTLMAIGVVLSLARDGATRATPARGKNARKPAVGRTKHTSSKGAPKAQERV